MSQYTKISEKIIKSIGKKDKQDEGIFFSPKDAREKIFSFLKELEFCPEMILEPSFGSGEFINDLEEEFSESLIYGVEKNEIIYNEVINNLEINENRILLNGDFLEYENEDKFDLIIGNPPYFVTKEKNKKCMTGRGNIFVLFLYKCLDEHLNDNGILAFILPTSFYNCQYYEPCRRYIYNNITILHIEEINVNFYDTKQKTMILILKKEKSKNDNFILKIDNNIYITPYFKELREFLSVATTIKKLNCKVKTGTVTWNEHKSKLTNDKHEGTLLIYSSNIINNNLVIDNLLGNEKKQYIKNINKNKDKGPVILINRGYGNNFEFKYTYLKENIEFYAENHLNVIYSVENNNEKINIINKSLKNSKTKEFLKLFVGNGSLSKTEIETILPIFL
jgi:type I restriction-modification system DNA methylase subunit